MKLGYILLFLLLCSLRSKENVSELYSTEINQIQYLNEDFRELMREVRLQADTIPFSFFHIGDSHVQIGSFTDGVMDEFEKTGIPCFEGWTSPNHGEREHIGRDFSWELKGNTQLNELNRDGDKSQIGFSGRTVFLENGKTQLIVKTKDKKRIAVVQLLHETNDKLEVTHRGSDNDGNANYQQGFSVKTLGKYGAHKKHLKLRLKNNSAKTIPLFGVRVNENWWGVEYSNLGVSGSTFLDWNQAGLFEKQLQPLRPQLLLITLGTNDAYRMGNNEAQFKSKVISLIQKIKRAAPETNILLMTVPETAYQGKEALHLDFVNQTIRQVAIEEQIALWDWYAVTGGKGALEIWKKHEMFDADQLHLSAKGYKFLGKILVEALLKAAKA